jgi:uncharacterized protein
MRMVTTRAAAFAAAILSMPYVAAAQAETHDAFVVRIAADTLMVENVVRSASRLEGDITGGAVGRMTYSLALGPGATTPEMTLWAWRPGVAGDEAPMQDVRLRLIGDTVHVDITGAAGTVTQRIATRPDAILYVNPSMALVEQVLRRARALGGPSATVPVFAVQGGQTLDATVTWLPGDSALLVLGSEMRVAVAPDGSLLGAAVPAQRLTTTRVAGAHVTPIRQVQPDYSAPADAPYTAEHVVIPTPAGHTLAGTLTLPRGVQRAPAVVTITGSGLQDRDQALPNIPGYRPFREVADTLGRRAIAVLRLDDRGFGESTGNAAAATSADFADDIRAALAYLRTRPDIDPDRLALVGHSEGGLIAPLVAATDTTLAGIVLIAGPAHTGRRIIEYQQRFAIENSPGIPPAARDSALAAAREQLQEMANSQPWLRFFLDHDPLPTARSVRRTPVLVLQGETDRQVTLEQAEELAAAFRAGGNPDVAVRVFPGVNHLLLRDPDGNPANYAALTDRSVVPELRGVLAEWLAARLR